MEFLMKTIQLTLECMAGKICTIILKWLKTLIILIQHLFSSFSEKILNLTTSSNGRSTSILLMHICDRGGLAHFHSPL